MQAQKRTPRQSPQQELILTHQTQANEAYAQSLAGVLCLGWSGGGAVVGCFHYIWGFGVVVGVGWSDVVRDVSLVSCTAEVYVVESSLEP